MLEFFAVWAILVNYWEDDEVRGTSRGVCGRQNEVLGRDGAEEVRLKSVERAMKSAEDKTKSAERKNTKDIKKVPFSPPPNITKKLCP